MHIKPKYIVLALIALSIAATSCKSSSYRKLKPKKNKGCDCPHWGSRSQDNYGRTIDYSISTIRWPQ
jgi:hypothetical protein